MQDDALHIFVKLTCHAHLSSVVQPVPCKKKKKKKISIFSITISIFFSFRSNVKESMEAQSM